MTMPKKKTILLKKKSIKAQRDSSAKELGDGHSRTSSGGRTSKKKLSLHQSSVPSSVESGRDSWASEEIRRKTDGMGLTFPQSFEEKKRKRARKRRIKRIIRTIKEAPPVFKGVDGEEDPKAKKESANSQPSPAMKKLESRMRERKLKMRAFTAKNPRIRQLLLAFTSPEVQRSPTLVQSTIGSKEEEVARELIGKTAKHQFRKQQGVWASWGKPYKCHGIPNLNPLQQTPMPEVPYSLDGPNKLASFKFFADPDHVVSSTCKGEECPKAAVKRRSASQIKKEKELKLARRSTEMDQMLMKMGLLFPHDLDHAKFPKDHLQVSNDITKLIKYAGVYFQELREGMKRSIPRSLSVAPLEEWSSKRLLARPLQQAGWEKVHFLKGHHRNKAHQLCHHAAWWKKTNLTLRLKHEKDLRQQLSARMDRRERIRASSLFSSEEHSNTGHVHIEFRWLEGGGKLEKALLINLCSNLARIPEELAYQGRMVNVIPILEFIGKELHVTSHEFNTILRDSTLHQKLHVEYMLAIIST